MTRPESIFMRGGPSIAAAAQRDDMPGIRIMAAKTRFRGSFTALVTPFKNGSVDEKAFRDLVDVFQDDVGNLVE